MTLTEDFRSKIVFLPPVILDEDVPFAADRIYEPFRKQLLAQPALWRFGTGIISRLFSGEMKKGRIQLTQLVKSIGYPGR